MEQAEVGSWQCQDVVGNSIWGGLFPLESLKPFSPPSQVVLYTGRSFLQDRRMAVIQSSKCLGTILCLILNFWLLLARLTSPKWSSVKKTNDHGSFLILSCIVIVISTLCHGPFCSCWLSCTEKHKAMTVPTIFQVPSHPWHGLPNILLQNLIISFHHSHRPFWYPKVFKMSCVAMPVSMATSFLFFLFQRLFQIGESDFSFETSAFLLIASSPSSLPCSWIQVLRADGRISGMLHSPPWSRTRRTQIYEEAARFGEVYGLQRLLPTGWVIIPPLRVQRNLSFLWVQ